MMAIGNPDLSLKNLNDLESKVVNNIATVNDYEEIDFLVSSIGGKTDYIKNTLIENNIRDFNQYILKRKDNSDDYKLQLGRVFGTIRGVLDFLKSYALKHKFYV